MKNINTNTVFARHIVNISVRRTGSNFVISQEGNDIAQCSDIPGSYIVSANYGQTMFVHVARNIGIKHVAEVPCGTSLNSNCVAVAKDGKCDIALSRLLVPRHLVLPARARKMFLYHCDSLESHMMVTWDINMCDFPDSFTTMTTEELHKLPYSVSNDVRFVRHNPITIRSRRVHTLTIDQVLCAITQSKPNDTIQFLNEPSRFIQELCKTTEVKEKLRNDNIHVIEYAILCDIDDMISNIRDMSRDVPAGKNDNHIVSLYRKEQYVFEYSKDIQKYRSHIYDMRSVSNFALFRRWYISEYIAHKKMRKAHIRHKDMWRDALRHVDTDVLKQVHRYQDQKDPDSPFMTELSKVHKKVLDIIEHFFKMETMHSTVNDHNSLLCAFAKQYLWIDDTPVFFNPVAHKSIDDAVNNGVINKSFYAPYRGFDVGQTHDGKYVVTLDNRRIYGATLVCHFDYDPDIDEFVAMVPS